MRPVKAVRVIPEADLLLTVREVAKWLNLHVNTVSRLDRLDLPYIRVCRRGDRRYRRGDVQRYLKRLSDSAPGEIMEEWGK